MIPEIDALDARPNVIRIPNQMDVPVTKRVIRLIDSDSFQRLRHVSQLGLVSLVYPGAVDSRFEHSLGVYKNSLLFLRRLFQIQGFQNAVDVGQVESTVVAALLHDLGHWSFCHPIEDMGLAGIPNHEAVAGSVLRGPLRKVLESDWNLDIELVIRLIQNRPNGKLESLLCSIISGPIDIDKMDYLYRDSLHCGVPYGMNFDAPRLVNSICIDRAGQSIAISSKGKTAAEMMVFARYVMFSEVYWHHAVRSATAMLQRLFFDWYQNHRECCDVAFLKTIDDRSFEKILKQGTNEHGTALWSGLFGPKRQLYKRLVDYNSNQNPKMFNAIAHQPYDKLLQLGNQLGHRLSERYQIDIGINEILIDAPPPGLEVQFDIEVLDGQRANKLELVSPVVNALAKKQFDDFVKRVRVFVHPRLVNVFDDETLEHELLEVIA